jgi:glutaredoxin
MIKPGPAEVRLYTALGCPFCPVVKQRLIALSDQMSFPLKEIDVTLKPSLLAAKGIRAVPVVEAGERQLVGNATSEQLAALISGISTTQRAN